MSFLAAAEAIDTSTWARFSHFTYSGKATTQPGPGEYLNPVIAGFYPDPSICRVGNDYYLVNSSFQYFPGIPLWHSTDLVNWTQIGNVIDRPSQYQSKGGPVSAGMYAPTIRYHQGTFYVVCTLVGGHGNFYVTSKAPKGPWSDPIYLPHTGGIDPSLFFDDDGRCYVCNCDEPPNNHPEYNGHRTIRLQELDLSLQKTVGEQTILVNGGTDITQHPIWCEGPHLYKIGGTYYLMAAQGGTSTDHSEVIFKSDSLRGPYVPGPNNPMLTARDMPVSRPFPVTCTGHADLVETQNHEWFAVFLACEPYHTGFYNTGRQTFMLPVRWNSGWPTILPPKTPVPLTMQKPNLPAGQPAPAPTTGNIAFTDDFDSDALAPRWVTLRAPASKWCATSKAEKTLFLEPRADWLSGHGNPSFVAIRQQNNSFICAVTLSTQTNSTNCVAGLAAFQNEGHYFAINVRIDSGHLAEISLEEGGGNDGARRLAVSEAINHPQPKMLTAQKLPDKVTSIELKLVGANSTTQCFYKIGNGAFIQLGQDLQSSFLSTETAGGFQGVTLGMFARTTNHL
jgi:alpha-N-arabinofuranosidase